MIRDTQKVLMIEDLKMTTIVDHIVEALMFTKKKNLASKNLRKLKMKSSIEKKAVVQDDTRIKN